MRFRLPQLSGSATRSAVIGVLIIREGDRIDGDAIAGNLQGKAAGQSQQAALCRTLRCGVRAWDRLMNRRDVDDPAVTAGHLAGLDEMPAAVERSVEVRTDHTVPFRRLWSRRLCVTAPTPVRLTKMAGTLSSPTVSSNSSVTGH